MWKPGEIIRNKESGKAYFVVTVYRGICSLIFDPTVSGVVLPIGILLYRDYDKFARDIEMEEIKKELLGEAIELHYKPLPIIHELKK